MTPHSYIICTTPRSGSTLLCDLLSGTGIAGHPGSYFRRQSIPDWARQFNLDVNAPGFDRAYLEVAKQMGIADKGMFGLRMMWGTLPELVERLDNLFPNLASDTDRLQAAFGSIRYIHLSRADKVAQAVSRVKAEQSGLWHKFADGSVREQLTDYRESVYDPVLINTYMVEATADDQAWNDWFKKHNLAPYCLTYEQLAEEPQVALDAVLGALELAPIRVTITSQKLAGDLSLDWIARFRAEQLT